MGVGRQFLRLGSLEAGLNTLFVRYGCGTHAQRNTLLWLGVLIPYSSGMGVGPDNFVRADFTGGLNTLFVRYGCGTPRTPFPEENQPS